MESDLQSNQSIANQNGLNIPEGSSLIPDNEQSQVQFGDNPYLNNADDNLELEIDENRFLEDLLVDNEHSFVDDDQQIAQHLEERRENNT